MLRQEESAEAFSTQIAETTLEAEQERERLLEARNEFAALRAAEVARGREEADAIVAAARAEEATAHARIEELQQAQAQREAEHATQIAQAQRERAEAEASYLERLRQREAEHEAQQATASAAVPTDAATGTSAAPLLAWSLCSVCRTTRPGSSTEGSFE